MNRAFILFLITACLCNNVKAQSLNFLGTFSQAGKYGAGGIFTSNGNNGSKAIVCNFPINNPGTPWQGGNLTEVNGLFYGTSATSGRYNQGLLFEYNPVTNAYVTKYTFGDSLIATAGNKGGTPVDGLLKASNGKLYGVTQYGGTGSNGVLFEFDPATGTYSALVSFSNSTGYQPNANLVQAPNGKLYGSTNQGGAASLGTIFEYNISTNSITAVTSFSSNLSKCTGLILNANGNLYSTVSGSASSPTISAVIMYNTTSHVITKKTGGLKTFQAPLFDGGNGKLYGQTPYAAVPSNPYGYIFEYDIALDTTYIKYTFTAANGNSYKGGCCVASTSKYYGALLGGTVTPYGTLFEYDYNTNTYSVKISFTPTSTVSYPASVLNVSSSGKFYGYTTYKSGQIQTYSLNEYDMVNNTVTPKLDINTKPVGANPSGNLFKASNGLFYGVAKNGGTYGMGTLFYFDAYSNTAGALHHFNDNASTITSGKTPGWELVEVNGKLYGVCADGGTKNGGVLFEFNIATNTYSVLYNFDATSSTATGIGYMPVSGLLLSKNGKLYGSTSRAANTNNTGGIFEFNPSTNAISKLVDFGNSWPLSAVGPLTEGQTGVFYGNATQSLFSYNKNTNTFSTLLTYTGTSGYGRGNPICVGNTIYNIVDGFSSYFKILKYDLVSNTYTFSPLYPSNTGSGDAGRITRSSDNNYYFLVNGRNQNLLSVNGGNMFKLDTVNMTCSSIANNFYAYNGHFPMGGLTEVGVVVPVKISENNSVVNNNIIVYPNPAHETLNIGLETESTQPTQLSIVNSIGQEIKQENLSGTNATVNVRELQTGLYFAKITMNGTTRLIKFIKD